MAKTSAGPSPEFMPRTSTQPVDPGRRARPRREARTPPRLAAASPAFPAPPTPATSFIGRAATLAAATDLVRRADVRLVTLTGPGGVGKTRLALTVAGAVRDHVPDGVAFVALAAVQDPNLVIETVARQLGLRPGDPQSSLQRLQHLLRDRACLLILDNVEQVVDAAPRLMDLIAACPRLKVLVTSRTVLRVTGEWEFPVPPMSVGDLDPATSEAVDLFVARAQSIRPDFALTPANVPVIARICARLDGLPLALELAAVQLRVLSPAGLLAYLDKHLPLPTPGPRDAPERQRTMHDAIAWSYHLLTPAEQAGFRRLSVFVGGFDLTAAALVIGESVPAALALVDALLAKSLLYRNEEPDADAVGDVMAPRFTMLETIREFAAGELALSGEVATIRQRHVAWSLAIAEQASAAFVGRGPGPWGKRLEQELGNLRAALTETDATGDVKTTMRLATALRPLWRVLGHEREGYRWLMRTLALGGDIPAGLCIQAQLLAGRLAADLGDFDAATNLAQTSATASKANEDVGGLASARFLLGAVAKDRDDQATALLETEAALALYRQVDDRYNIGLALCQLATLGNLGTVDHPGDPADQGLAERRYQEALALYQDLGNTAGIANALHGLAYLAYKRGNYQRAAELSRQTLAIRWEHRDQVGFPSSFEDLADIAGMLGHGAVAARLYGMAEAQREAIGVPISPFYRPDHDLEVAVARRLLPPTDFADAWDAGQTLSMADAVAEALTVAEQLAAEPDTPGGPNDDLAALRAQYGLTPRETEILALIAAERTNRQIADALFLSPATVKRHVSNILAKIEAPTRAEAISLVREAAPGTGDRV